MPDWINNRANIQNKRILSRSPGDRVCVCSTSTDQSHYWSSSGNLSISKPVFRKLCSVGHG